MYYNPEGLFSICFLACVAWWFWLGHKVIKAGDGRETARRLGRVPLSYVSGKTAMLHRLYFSVQGICQQNSKTLKH